MEVLNVSDTVEFKYINSKTKKIYYKIGKIVYLYPLYSSQPNTPLIDIITKKNKKYRVKLKNIVYKVACPYCKSHRLWKWQNNTEKYKKKKGKRKL